MKRFAIRLLLFPIPVFLWAVFVMIVDPFNRFTTRGIIPVATKEENIRSVNSLLYNMSDFENHPTSLVFIGDSRTKALPADYMRELSGQECFNLHSNAAKLNEIVDLFWFATRRTTLQEVYIGINFNMFNQYAYADRVTIAESMIDNPLVYLFNRSVAESCFILTGLRKMDSRERLVSREEFWKYNIETKADHYYGKYVYPTDLYARLKEVSDYCREHSIGLTFIIVPHHKEMRNRVSDYGLMEEEENFKMDISRLATTIDYDYANSVTDSKENFGDPIHFKPEIGRLIVEEIASGRFQVGHVLPGMSQSSVLH